MNPVRPRGRQRGSAGLALLWLGAFAHTPARADDPADESELASTSDDKHDTNATEPLPLPGQARNVARADDASEGEWLLLPRLLLAIPRLLFRAVTQPVVWGTAIEDEYHVTYRAEDLFFNDERTFGIYPTAFIDPPLRTNIGARLVDRDLLGQREGLSVWASYGGPHEQTYHVQTHTGDRLGEGRLGLSLEYTLQERDRFYGLGNADRVAPEDVEPPLDARDPGAAVRTRFNRDELSAKLSADTPLEPRLVLWASQQLRRRRLTTGRQDDPDTPWVTRIYALDSYRGLDENMHDLHTQVGLRWDGRTSPRRDIPRALPGDGLRLSTWAESQALMRRPRGVFGRFGIDAQQFVNLYRHDRVLRFRLRAVTVVGPIEEIPITDIPALGGASLLRGYNADRFRGRLTTLATVEYRYPVQESIAGYLFVDAGRAHADWEDISLENPRVGFGGGIVIYGVTGALFRFQVAASIDGGIGIHLRLNTTDETRDNY